MPRILLEGRMFNRLKGSASSEGIEVFIPNEFGADLRLTHWPTGGLGLIAVAKSIGAKARINFTIPLGTTENRVDSVVLEQ